MTLLDEALALLKELRPHAPIESAWLTDPNAPFDEEAWRNSPVATSSKMRDKIDALLARAEKETRPAPPCFWCGCEKDHPDHKFGAGKNHAYRVGSVVTKEEREAYALNR